MNNLLWHSLLCQTKNIFDVLYLNILFVASLMCMSELCCTCHPTKSDVTVQLTDLGVLYKICPFANTLWDQGHWNILLDLYYIMFYIILWNECYNCLCSRALLNAFQPLEDPNVSWLLTMLCDLALLMVKLPWEFVPVSSIWSRPVLGQFQPINLVTRVGQYWLVLG